jgi:hypothetical protein
MTTARNAQGMITALCLADEVLVTEPWPFVSFDAERVRERRTDDVFTA